METPTLPPHQDVHYVEHLRMEHILQAYYPKTGTLGVIDSLMGKPETNNPFVGSDAAIWLAGWRYGQLIKKRGKQALLDDLIFVLQHPELITPSSKGWTLYEIHMATLEFTLMISRIQMLISEWDDSPTAEKL